jgi:hypothetical protein
MNRNLLLAIIGLVLIVLAFFIFTQYGQSILSNILSYFSKPISTPVGIILFYGEGCPHCKIVDDFISQNKIEDKVKFTRLEVFNNKDNANVLLQKATDCKIDQNNVGVPFLWDGKSCLVGDVEIINFFKNAANIK